ncbi:MAG TPA: helix-turn-helix transcriptional regulator [Allosphingosinicella sp.]|jgi:DNA-binding CsgD family transcriptional regulator
MERHPVERLTQKQRACLRYVASGMTSKEIAPLLGIEPGSVDQHIKGAMRILDVGDRRRAARLLAAHEQAGGQRLVYQPQHVAVPPQWPITALSTDDEELQGGASGRVLNEEQAPFEALSAFPRTALPLPVWGAKPHHLGRGKRLAWIVAATIGIAVAFGSLISAIETLVRLRTG